MQVRADRPVVRAALAALALLSTAAAARADLRVIEHDDDTLRIETRIDSSHRVRILRDGDTLDIPIPPEPPRIPHWKDVDDLESDVLKIGEDALIDAGRVVRGSVVVLGGKAVIEGEVLEDVIVLGGDARLEPGAVVEGTAVAIGGRVRRDPEATLVGGDVSIPLGPSALGDGPMALFRPGFKIAAALAVFVVLFFLSALVELVAPQHLGRVAGAVESRVWSAFFAGVAVEVLFFPCFLLLLVTVIGIPLALLLPFAYMLAFLLGLTAVGMVVGARLMSRELVDRGARLRGVGVGLGLFFLVGAFGDLLRLVDGPVGWLGNVITLFAVAAAWTVATVGIGAVALSRFGRRTAPPGPLTAT